MRRHLLHALMVLLFAGLAWGCGESVTYDDTRSEAEQQTVAQPLNAKVFVTAEELAQFRDEGALILDARSAEDYAAGHLEGAVHGNGGKQFQDPLGLVVDDVVALQEAVRALGVNKDQKIVVYGKEVDSRASRLFWTLEYLGHGQVHLALDNYDALLEKLGETPETTPNIPEQGDFVVALRPSIVATAEEVQQVIDGETEGILVDTRRETEWHGTEVRGEGENADPRQGYIPTATWYYYENVFDAETKELRPKEELIAEFEELGLYQGDDVLVIPYCQTGVRSTYVYAIFRWMGHEKVKNYDGSWAEWSRSTYDIARTDQDPNAGE